jgi:uncharacterized membrane protein
MEKVVGYMRAGDRFTSESFTIVDVPGSEITEVTGINDLGHLVGNFDYRRGFTSIDGAVTEIGVPGSSSVSAQDIAWDDTVVGSYFDAASRSNKAFFRGPKGRILTFEVQVSDATNTIALGIKSKAGKIVGYFWGNHSDRGFIYDYVADLASLGGEDAWSTVAMPRRVPVQVIEIPGRSQTIVTAINATGVIVGRSLTLGFIGTPVP